MYYEINDTVAFKPVEGALWALESPENIITLPRFASNLLEILINENLKSLSRDHLLESIWQKNGWKASGNNLNNYMSIIRRSLATLGIKNIIVTIPKYGFSFHALKITAVPQDTPTESNEERFEMATISAPIEPQKRNKKSKNEEKKPVHRTLQLKWISIFLSFVMVLCLSTYIYLMPNKMPTDSVLGEYIGKYENCAIETIWNGGKNFYTMDMVLADIKPLIQDEQIDCLQDSHIYYYRSLPAKVKTFSGQRVMITICPADNLSACKNFQKYDISHD